MIEEFKAIKSEKSDLRQFGILIGSILLVIAGFLFWKEKELLWPLIIIGITLLVTGLIIPVILKPIYWAWMIFATILGWVMTRVIISVLFYAVLTPIGIIARLFGKQFLELKPDSTKNTYWNYRDIKNIEKDSYEKQF